MTTGNPLKVLVVDDEEPNLAEMAWLLGRDERIGTTQTASTGPDALEILRREPIDAVFLDIAMPGLSGLDVARELAQVRRDLPVVISSGNVPEQLQAQARQAGVRALLHKQYTLEELGAVIHWVLAGGQRLGLEPLQSARG